MGECAHTLYIDAIRARARIEAELRYYLDHPENANPATYWIDLDTKTQALTQAREDEAEAGRTCRAEMTLRRSTRKTRPPDFFVAGLNDQEKN